MTNASDALRNLLREPAGHPIFDSQRWGNRGITPSLIS
jgi:hypothetical protein